jgi:PAS domain S-box-containing protein
LKHSRLRSRGSFGLALPLLIVLFSLVGYVVTSETISSDRDTDAARRLEVDTVGAQVILGRAQSYVAGLGNILAGERVPGQQRFVQLAGGTAGGVGLLDAIWVQRIPGFARSKYEARIGAPITRLTPAGSFEAAPPAASYLAATFTTDGSPELPQGADVSSWPALATALRDRSSASAVSASELGWLGGQPGFYLLEAGSYGHGPNSRGDLVVFVPQGWLTASTGGDPRLLAVSLDGRHLEGFDSSPARSASFGMLGRRWRIDVATAPLTGLQTLLPWLALAWPIAAALIAVLVGRGIARRRRAEREVERIFDLSLDLLCIAGLDGHFKRVNPAFERTLGYTTQQLLSRPFLDFVHPDDHARTVETMEILERGEKLVQFENRYVCSDGSARWLQWSVRPMPHEGLLYAAARDVTDSRIAADKLRETQRMVEASRDELRLLADEQAALRRVATLVAQGVSATEVFDAVAAEMCELLGADSTHLLRYESDGTASVVAVEGDPAVDMAAVTRTVLAVEHAASGTGPDCLATLRHLGMGSELAEPIVVEGRPWGLMVAVWTQRQPVSAGAEARMAQFTELMATAIANGEARTEVAASRARVVAAADEERRRVVRDLHDGAQQGLVNTVITLKLAHLAIQNGDDGARALVTEALDHAQRATSELRELAHGILPAALTRGGLRSGVEALTARMSIPVETAVPEDRLSAAVEATAYFVVAEALTNVAKHARAAHVAVTASVTDGALVVQVRDDGIGGARADGTGLLGLRDRLAAVDGRLGVESPADGGTLVAAYIPLSGAPAEARRGTNFVEAGERPRTRNSNGGQ